MTWVLTLCWTFVWPLCSSIQEFDFPSYEACDRERAALVALPKKPDRASCTPKATFK